MDYEHARRTVTIEQFDGGDLFVEVVSRHDDEAHATTANVVRYTFTTIEDALNWLSHALNQEHPEFTELESDGVVDLEERLDRIEELLRQRRNPHNYWWSIGNDGQETLFT